MAPGVIATGVLAAVRFTLMEIMIGVTVFALTSGALAAAGTTSPMTSVMVALCLGPTVTGPPLLLWRRRQNTITGKWGAGERGWFVLGIYLTALLVANLVLPNDVRDTLNWLIVASAISSAIVVLLLMRRGLRFMFPESAARAQPVARWTNTFGLALLVLYACGGLVAFLVALS